MFALKKLSSDGGVASEALGLEATVALLDLEEAILAPAGGPGVGDEPVLLTVLLTPADNLDGVATHELVPDRPPVVLVDTGSVGHEGLVDLETALDGAVGHDFFWMSAMVLTWKASL